MCRAYGYDYLHLAAISGVPRSTVFRYLGGGNNPTDLRGETLEKLLHALGLRIVHYPNREERMKQLRLFDEMTGTTLYRDALRHAETHGKRVKDKKAPVKKRRKPRIINEANMRLRTSREDNSDFDIFQ